MIKEKSKFVVKTSSEKVNIDVPVGGEHFVYNALCGFMVGKVLGLTAKEIQNGISKFELTKNNMEINTLEQTLDMPPISKEIKKNDEFLQALKEFRKNLD